jgi:Superinfection immunity protein
MRYFSRLALIVAALLMIIVVLTSCVYNPMGRSFGPFEFLLGVPFSLIGLALYLLPTIIAAARRSTSLVGIILVNILLGWTFIGWIVALVWSLAGQAQRR